MKIQLDSAMPAPESPLGTGKPEGTVASSGAIGAQVGASEAEERKVADSVNSMQKNLNRLHETNFELEFDREIDRVIIKYKNVEGQVVRQIPSQDFVEFERAFVQTIGLLYDRKV